MKINVDKYIKEALQLLPVQRDCADEVNEFFIQRMIIFLSEKYNKNILEACSMKNPLVDIADYVERVKVVKELNSPQLLENANRVIRILKDTSVDSINESFFKESAEKDLYDAVKKLNDNVDYKTYLTELENLNPYVTKFFDDVLVMDKDENVKKNRLALLTLLRKKYDYLTDFSKV